MFYNRSGTNSNINKWIKVCAAINNIACKKKHIDYFEMQWNKNDRVIELSANLDQHRGTGNDTVISAPQSIYQYLQKKV
jgi:hypothetical protein